VVTSRRFTHRRSFTLLVVGVIVIQWRSISQQRLEVMQQRSCTWFDSGALDTIHCNWFDFVDSHPCTICISRCFHR
jgi:hypothetical protein